MQITLVIIFICLIFGEKVGLGDPLTWRGLITLCLIPILVGNITYHIGWMNGVEAIQKRIKYWSDINKNKVDKSHSNI